MISDPRRSNEMIEATDDIVATLILEEIKQAIVEHCARRCR